MDTDNNRIWHIYKFDKNCKSCHQTPQNIFVDSMAGSSSSSTVLDQNKSQNEMMHQRIIPEGLIIEGQIDTFKRGKTCHQVFLYINFQYLSLIFV